MRELESFRLSCMHNDGGGRRRFGRWDSRQECSGLVSCVVGMQRNDVCASGVRRFASVQRVYMKRRVVDAVCSEAESFCVED